MLDDKVHIIEYHPWELCRRDHTKRETVHSILLYSSLNPIVKAWSYSWNENYMVAHPIKFCVLGNWPRRAK